MLNCKLDLDRSNIGESQISVAIAVLKQGAVIGFPTETLYGLGVDPRSKLGVASLFNCKGREASLGIPLIASSAEVVSELAFFASSAQREQYESLVVRYWPGALTLVLDFQPAQAVLFPAGIAAADGSFAVRCSASLTSRVLAEGIGGLITATSANPHRQGPARTSEEVRRYFREVFVVEPLSEDSFIPSLDGHPLPSTIVDVRGPELKVLRQGVVKL